MERTYRAVLRGDRVNWIDPPPRLEGDTEVVITFVEVVPEAVLRARRKSAVAALAELAAAGGIASIPDPVAWQREIRKDRPLPSREE
jgi:hypothetical protein